MSANTDEERDRPDRLKRGEIQPGDVVLFIGFPGIDAHDENIGSYATVVSVASSSLGPELIRLEPQIGDAQVWNSGYFKKISKTRSAPQKHACNCSMRTLMMTGCQCGGK